MSNIESFINEQQLANRLEELRELKISANDITIISQHPIVHEYENVTMINSEGSIWDKLVSFFSSGDPTDRAFNNLDLTQGEKDEHRQALEEGNILLYINDDLLLTNNNTDESDYAYENIDYLNTRNKYVTQEEVQSYTNEKTFSEPLADEKEIQQADIREEGDPNTDDLSLRDREGFDESVDTTYDDVNMSEDDYPPLPDDEVRTLREKDKKLNRE